VYWKIASCSSCGSDCTASFVLSPEEVILARRGAEIQSLTTLKCGGTGSVTSECGNVLLDCSTAECGNVLLDCSGVTGVLLLAVARASLIADGAVRVLLRCLVKRGGSCVIERCWWRWRKSRRRWRK
jgi:hypothetical protein